MVQWNKGVSLLFFLLWLGAIATAGWAKPNFPPIFTAAYSLQQGGTVEKAAQNCSLCHTTVPKLNPYGTTIKAGIREANTKNLTAAVLHSLDDKDADGDGATNGAEIAGDTLPGDAKSKPAGTSTASQSLNTTGTKAATNSTSPPPAEVEEPGPFDLKNLLFPKHAQHRVLVHFPIALFIISLCFDLLGRKKQSTPLMLAGYYNLAVGAASSLLTVITGILAWRIAFGGATLTGPLLWHLVLGIVTCILLFVLWRVRLKQDRGCTGEVSTTYLALAFLTLLIITLTGHLGGYLAGS